MGRPPKNQAEIDAGNQFASYMDGWKHGCAVKAMDRKFTEHTNKLIKHAYELGYLDGRVARGHASLAASDKYGHHPSILRSNDFPITPIMKHVFTWSVATSNTCLQCGLAEEHEIHEVGP